MWHYRVNGRGPAAVAEGLFKPLVAEWASMSFDATEFVALQVGAKFQEHRLVGFGFHDRTQETLQAVRMEELAHEDVPT